ncbi:endothelin-converting enzyme homolog [Sitodiplosis mosellana]|uniref:endothelin-converting enzyme homolog n=1 Tax=Sitodiplosis mosellana TaxID=263140 RepID=UPI002444AB5F|nr:endothelin-converting enzyme homolog [Sitodiplosis mosellana]
MNAGKQAESGKKLVEEYLSKRFGLPDILSMIIEGKSISFDGFDWITTIAKVKKTLDIDIIFEFDIIPHPTNVNQKEFKFGKPASEAVTSEKIKKYIDFLHPYSNDDVIDGLAKRILKIDKKFTTMLSHKMNDATDANMLDGRKQALNFVEIILNKPAQTDIENRLIIWNEDSRKYFDDVNDFISSASKTDVALYIWWKIVNEMVNLIEDHYDVSSQHLSAHCANEVNELMGIIMSYAIAQPDFHSATKPIVQRMMDEIRSSFHDLVEKSDWLSDETKARILEKSQAMKMNVGFPEWIFNDTQTNAYFGHIKFNENSFLENIIRLRGSRMNRKLNSLTSTDDMDWGMMPTEVNAKNDYPTNTMTIPQAILQFPFYNLGLEALNFGATDLGHEFMHGFDSIGIQYDKDGNWNVGWLGIGDEYNKRAECLIDQYNGFSMPNMNDHKWCYSMDTKDQSVEDTIRNDVHSPNESRVNGVVANMKEFQQAFKCSTESKMVSKKVCQVW